ncbi:MAG: ROK family protein [Helicobacteraceae bacterium]|jgi:glucokinase|nr:ROK family protein [Helicobacteraceae bacterium]
MKLVFDIGGTKLRRAVIGDRGEFITTDERPSGGDLKGALEALSQEAIAKYPIDFVGACFAGHAFENRILSAPNIDLGALKGVDFAAWIKERFGLLGAIDNDLKCAALAEAADRPQVSALFALYIGTGIGGSYVENGALIRGANNNAGEIGHIPFEKTPFLCGCGGEMCLESSASGAALNKWREYYGLNDRPLNAPKASASNDRRDHCGFTDRTPNELNAYKDGGEAAAGGGRDRREPKTLSALAASDNPLAREIAERFYRGVDHAVQTIASLFNPQVIALGGGVALAEPSVLTRAQAAVGGAYKPSRLVAIELTRLGDKANLLGASLL